ncbi:MAG: DUF1934 domain-containing protein [Clostridiales bacterium]|nr:DUF1934 domain-containing protein [Candidatus Crickella caballi]
MKKTVSLKITSSQYEEKLQPSGEAFVRKLELEDSIEILTEGTMYDKNDALYILYEESKELMSENIRTLLKLKEDTLRIRRYTADDDDDMDMELRQGVRNITRYKLPMLASMDIEVYTNKLEKNLNEEGYGTISVDYRIKFDKIFTRRNILEIEVKPA